MTPPTKWSCIRRHVCKPNVDRMASTLVSRRIQPVRIIVPLCTVGVLSELFSGGAFSTDDDDD